MTAPLTVGTCLGGQQDFLFQVFFPRIRTFILPIRLSLKPDEANDLFEVIEDRTLSGSSIITAQLPVKEWHVYLQNETIADAMMDRLIYSAHRIEMKGESMRKILSEK